MTTTTTATTGPAVETEIHTRAILVDVKMTSWSARKYDKRETMELNRRHGAAGDAARVNKLLVPQNATSYKALTSLICAIRDQHYALTLPWSDAGRLLPVAQLQTYQTWIRAQRTAFDRLVADFADEYPALRAAAPARLNGLYRASDYPTVEDLIGRFSLRVDFAPVPVAGDIRCDLGADQRAMIETSITEGVRLATQTAMQDAWQRLHDVAAHIAERLSDPKAIFRDTLIGNAVEICDTLKRLNVTGDPNLEALRARVEAELTKVSPATLRDVPEVRATVAEQASAIVDAMAGFYGAPGVK